VTKQSYKVKTLLEGLDMINPDCEVFIHKETKELITITCDDFRMYESLSDDELNNLKEWEKKTAKMVQEILYSEPCPYLQLPTTYILNEHQIMVDFAYTLPSGLSEVLLQKLYHKGAFSEFKIFIQRHLIVNDWYDYKKQAFIKKLVEWAAINNIKLEYK
jgi:hypothetical protein